MGGKEYVSSLNLLAFICPGKVVLHLAMLVLAQLGCWWDPRLLLSRRENLNRQENLNQQLPSSHRPFFEDGLQSPKPTIGRRRGRREH